MNKQTCLYFICINQPIHLKFRRQSLTITFYSRMKIREIRQIKTNITFCMWIEIYSSRNGRVPIFFSFLFFQFIKNNKFSWHIDARKRNQKRFDPLMWNWIASTREKLRKTRRAFWHWNQYYSIFARFIVVILALII